MLAKYANDIRTTGQQLIDLLENLLEWAQVQTGELIVNNQAYCLHEMLQPSLEIYKNYASKESVQLRVIIDPTIKVLVDEQIINTVIRNLLSNALKHTPKGGHVVLSARTQGEFVIIRVSDNGVGLTAEQIQRIKNNGRRT